MWLFCFFILRFNGSRKQVTSEPSYFSGSYHEKIDDRINDDRVIHAVVQLIYLLFALNLRNIFILNIKNIKVIGLYDCLFVVVFHY